MSWFQSVLARGCPKTCFLCIKIQLIMILMEETNRFYTPKLTIISSCLTIRSCSAINVLGGFIIDILGLSLTYSVMTAIEVESIVIVSSKLESRSSDTRSELCGIWAELYKQFNLILDLVLPVHYALSAPLPHLWVGVLACIMPMTCLGA